MKNNIKNAKIFIEDYDKKHKTEAWSDSTDDLAKSFVEYANNFEFQHGDIMGECPSCGEKIQYGISEKLIKKIKKSKIFKK